METRRASDSLALRVLEAVADRENTDIADLPSLHDSINAEALDSLFAPKADGTSRDGEHVRFFYAGYTVTVHSDGRVELTE